MSENVLKVTYEVTLDILTYEKKISPAIRVTQGDTCTRFIHAKILKNGTDFPLDGSYTVTFNFKRPDGKMKRFDGEIQEDGSVLCVLPTWAIDVPTSVGCDITISNTDEEGEHKLTTPDILITVAKACVPDGATVEA